MLKHLLLLLLVVSIGAVAVDSVVIKPKEKEISAIDWQPVYGYKGQHIKLYVDRYGMKDTKVKDSIITSGTILIVPDEPGELTGTDIAPTLPSLTPDKPKTIIFKSVAIYIGVDCKNKALMNVANLYYSQEMPGKNDVPVSIYEYPTTKESIVFISNLNFIYTTFCPIST